MTDLPRRSYPLVVAPPGGFEDAVRRGRRVRRRRAGGTTGAAVALVGALAYSTMGGTNGTSGLQPTDDIPRIERPVPGVVATSPSPEASLSPSAGATVGPRDTGTARDDRGYQPGQPTATATVPQVRPPRTPAAGHPFAARAPITRSTPTPRTDAETSCPPVAGNPWCARADVLPEETEADTRYKLSYTLCRAIDAGLGTVTFGRRQQANFATRTASSDEMLWTYSKGQPVVPDDAEVEIPQGYCVTWSTYWNVEDDWGYVPKQGPGQYVLVANSMGTSDTNLPSDDFEFTVQ